MAPASFSSPPPFDPPPPFGPSPTVAPCYHAYPPPSKRPRLSSPVLPPGMASQHYSPQSPLQQQPSPNFQQPSQQLPMQPQPQQQPQQHNAQPALSMPPPIVPTSRPTDPTDLADALASAGIDLKEEEARLAAFSATNGIGNGIGGGGAGLATGPFANGYGAARGYPQVLSAEEQAEQVKRQQAERRANHFNDPFLTPTVLSNRIYKKTVAESLGKPFTLASSNGVMQTAGPAADVVTLLSLATSDRLKGLITRSIALARRRRTSTIVPQEWVPRVKGATPDPSSAISPRGGTKRSFDVLNGLPPLPTSPYIPANETTRALLALKQREWDNDQARLRKRAKREAVQVAENKVNTSSPATPDGSAMGPGTPTPDLSMVGPGERKLSAKEARKIHNTAMSEAQSHRNANATANLMMGGGAFGSKKKKKTYAWMNAGATSPAPGTPVLGTPTAAVGLGTIVATGGVHSNGGLEWVGQKFGRWKEDGEKERPVQIRDWVGGLEDDGRVGKKGISRAYMRLK